MKNLTSRLLIVAIGFTVTGCATVSAPVFDSDHPANADAPAAAQSKSPSSLSSYRDDSSSNSIGRSKSDKPVDQKPNEHGGGHGKQ